MATRSIPTLYATAKWLRTIADTSLSTAKAVVLRADDALREQVGRPRPTVIDAGKSKLSDARAPLVIHVTDEQANKISEFTRSGR
jgi:hypothetical protein